MHMDMEASVLAFMTATSEVLIGSRLHRLCRPGKITKPIFDEIEEVLADRADVEVPAPSPAAQARAEARGPVEQRLPNLGTGSAAILLVLYRVRPCSEL